MFSGQSPVFFLVLLTYSTYADIVVDLPDGKIQGLERQTPNNFSFFSFTGIPYARPPVGEYRFKSPQSPEKWNSTLDATKDAPACVSNFYNATSSDQSEDCLILNVYTPNLNNDSKLPVMFWIHGGAWIQGGSKYIWFGPDFLIEKDIVLVTISYRLGPFGFLSTGDSVIPGNMGVKDQLLALKWTNKNIGLFGGDPDKITVFGQSAGSGSVGLHLLSKKSAGLFRGAICQSGSAISPWIIGQKPKTVACNLLSAIKGNFSSGENCSSQDVLNTLRQFSTQEIIDAANTIGSSIYNFLFTPVLEPESDDAFLTVKDHNYELFESGNFTKVPLMIGLTSEEFLGMIVDLDVFVKETTKKYDENLLLLVPNDLHITSDSTKEEAAKEIKKIYIKDDTVTFQEDPGALVRYISDDWFVRGVRKQAELMSDYTNVYFYRYSYNGTIRYRNNIVKGAEGIGHSAELPFLFAQRLGAFDNTDFSNYTQSDLLNHNRLVKIWTDFAKTLNPTPEKSTLLSNLTWPEFDCEKEKYVDIGDDITVKTNIRETSYRKWVKIYEKYAEGPLITF